MGIGYSAGSRIHNGSWGSPDPSYTFKTSSIDDYLWFHDDMLLVMAIGNSGTRYGTSSLLSPSNAKNVLSVGATGSYGRDLVDNALDYEYLAPFSSRGPTLDGRIKPDIVAPGYAILSAGARPNITGECDPTTGEFDTAFLPYENMDDPNTGLTYKAGTSMAAPVVSGSAAILRQYFAEGYYPTGAANATRAILNPSSALLKAILINGAQDLKGVDFYGVADPVAPYDRHQGHGRMNILTSIPLQGVNDVSLQIYDRKQLDNGQEHSYTLSIMEQCCAEEVSVTLVWTDHPGTPGCTHCLVNDLDLMVTDSSGVKHYPNGLTQRDSSNNVERIRIPADMGDEFTVTVTGANLIVNQQAYSLVATGCFGGKADTGSTTCVGSASHTTVTGCPPVEVCRCDTNQQCMPSEAKLSHGAELTLCLDTTGMLALLDPSTSTPEGDFSTQSLDLLQLLNIDTVEIRQQESGLLTRPVIQGSPQDGDTTTNIASNGNQAIFSTSNLSPFWSDSSKIIIEGSVVMGYTASSSTARQAGGIFADYQCSSTFTMDVELERMDEEDSGSLRGDGAMWSLLVVGLLWLMFA